MEWMGNGGIVPSPRQLFFLVKIDDFGYCNFFAMPLLFAILGLQDLCEQS